jgi:hypothetical protein
VLGLQLPMRLSSAVSTLRPLLFGRKMAGSLWDCYVQRPQALFVTRSFWL